MFQESSIDQHKLGTGSAGWGTTILTYGMPSTCWPFIRTQQILANPDVQTVKTTGTMAGSVSVLIVDATSCFYALGEQLAIKNANGGNSDPDQTMTTGMTTPQKNAWDAMFTYTDGLAIVTSFTFPIAIY